MAAFARWRSGRGGRDALLFGALWLLAELARGVIFTGFPWVASGYAQVDGRSRRSRRGWASMASASSRRCWPSAWRCCPRPRCVRGATGRDRLALALALALAGSRRILRLHRRPARLTVTLLQGNVAQDEKFAGRQRHAQALASGTASNCMSARRAWWWRRRRRSRCCRSQLPAGYWQALLRAFPSGPQAALIGMPLGDEEGYTNSVVGLWPRGRLPAASTATTSTTWCRSASSSRPVSAGSPS